MTTATADAPATLTRKELEAAADAISLKLKALANPLAEEQSQAIDQQLDEFLRERERARVAAAERVRKQAAEVRRRMRPLQAAGETFCAVFDRVDAAPHGPARAELWPAHTRYSREATTFGVNVPGMARFEPRLSAYDGRPDVRQRELSGQALGITARKVVEGVEKKARARLVEELAQR